MSKVRILILWVSSLAFVPTIAQEHYFKPYFGYCIGTSKITCGTVDEKYLIYPDESSKVQYIYNNVNFSLGDGSNFGLTYGFKTRKNIGFELGVSYFKGKPEEIRFSSETKTALTPVYYIMKKQKNIFSAKAVNIMPSVIFYANGNSIKPYLKAGVLGSFAKLRAVREIEYRTNMYGYVPRETLEYTYESDSKFTMGCFGAIGIDLFSQSSLSLFSEVLVSQMLLKPESATCTKFIYQGEDKTDQLLEYERTINYVDSYSATDKIEWNAPQEQLKRTFFLSSFSVSGGIRISL